MAEFGLRFQDLRENHYIHRNTFFSEDASEEKMKRASLAIATLVLISTFCLTLTILPNNAEATTRYVGGAGPGNYTKIQDAIAVSDPGDTVFVYSGTYNEDLSISKPLNLFGENKDTTIIRGSGTADTVLVLSDGVNVTGFSVENGGPGTGTSGIRLFFVQNCHVTNNSVYDNVRGISFWGAFNNVVVSNNVSNNENGIYIWHPLSHSNLIANNEIWSNSAGIYGDDSYNNSITGNIITNNDYGIYLFSTSHNTIHNNLMVGNGVFIYGNSLTHWNTHTISASNIVNGKPLYYWKNVTGGSIPLGAGQVILANCSGIAINNQNVSNGSVGIEVGFSSHISITNSTSSSNFQDGIYIYSSDNITIADSNVSDNGNDGIFMDHSITNVLMNNIASSNGVNGIHLYATDLNTITNNGIFLNDPHFPPGRAEHCALYLNHSNYGVITENSVLSNLDCAFSLVDSNVNNIYDNNFSNNEGGVRIKGADDNRFTNNTVHGNTGPGILLSASSHNIFALNTVTLHRFGMISRYAHDNTIIGNYISSKDDEFLYGGITIWDSTSYVLADNVMVGDGLIVDGSSLAHWNTHVIDTSNTVNGRPVYYWKNITGGTVPLGASEVILANCTRVVVEYQDLDSGTAGIELGFSSNNTVSNNRVSSSKRGIYLYSSDRNAIAGNTVSFSNCRGIYLILSNHNTISDSTLWGNKYGIVLGDSDNNTVTDNNVWDNTRTGIVIGPEVYLGPGSNDNNIINNTVFSNRDGIVLYDSYNNNVSNNSLVNNINGVYISLGGNNRIYHNNLVDNTQQAYDDTDANQWDDGYPSGGNYWSDYTGLDLKSGPGQDLPGNDGIGDTPYVIDFNSQDRYPLMNLTGTYPPSAPLNLSATAGDRQVFLAWNAPSFDGGLPISNYRIYRGTTSGGEVFLVEIGNVLTHLDTGLTNGQMYCYKVSAVNAIGEGPLSNEACATPTTTPGAPTILQADLTGSAHENVTLTWSLSIDDGSGQNSVVGYEIYRNTSFDSTGSGYQFIALIPNGEIEFVDNMAGEGDPDNYFYQVCAVDLNNLTNCSGNQAGKFTRPLFKGPNLVSIPLIQSNQSIEIVLQTVEFDKAWIYNSSIQDWRWYMTFKPYRGELVTVTTTQGVWVNVTDQSNLTLAGIVPSTTAIHLDEGWNLVGFPSFQQDYRVVDLKTSVAADRVEGFDALSPPYFLKLLTDGDILQTGFGYWLKADIETVWIVANS